MTGRDDLEAALRANGSAKVPEPDTSFVDGLERRLMVADRSNVVPMARRTRRIGAAAVVTATVVFAGAAAAAGVAITHPFRHDAPVQVNTTMSTVAISSAPTTTVVSAPVVVDTTAPLGVVTSTIVEPSPTSTAVTVSPSTTRAVVPQTTLAPTSAPPTTLSRTTTTTVRPSTTTTEVKVPATITLSCSADGSAVHCSWAGLPAGTDRYVVLRSQPNGGTGRAYFVPVGTTTWTDPIATTGTTATYLVHALDAKGASLGHSNAVSVPCC
jgi:hypothetical protein